MEPGDARRLRREVLTLVALVLVVHGLFIAAYYLAGIARRPESIRTGYAVVWTVATLLVVLRGLGRVRAERLRRLRGVGR
jgi:hypothetical protein